MQSHHRSLSQGKGLWFFPSRLAFLELQGILARVPGPDDRRKDFCTLTEKGLDLIPVVLISASAVSGAEIRLRVSASVIVMLLVCGSPGYLEFSLSDH